MNSSRLLLALVVFGAACTQTANAQASFGAQGAEGEPNRRQQWLVPSPDFDIAAHALLFRPPGDGPFPLAVIAHASTQNVLRRAQMPQPEYRALAAWLVARGFAVLVPERPGHGATGGQYLEDQGGCDEADYARAGRATADAIARGGRLSCASNPSSGRTAWSWSAIRPARWGALALAGESPQDVAAIIAFAPGRGGHANDLPNQVCAPHTLIAAAAEFGKDARVPVTWLVAANDSYFSPDLSRRAGRCVSRRRRQGGLPRTAGIRQRGPLAGGNRGRRQKSPARELDRALKPVRPAAAKKR